MVDFGLELNSNNWWHTRIKTEINETKQNCIEIQQCVLYHLKKNTKNLVFIGPGKIFKDCISGELIGVLPEGNCFKLSFLVHIDTLGPGVFNIIFKMNSFYIVFVFVSPLSAIDL